MATTAIGIDAQAHGENVIVIGDGCVSYTGNAVVIGDHLFGIPVPEDGRGLRDLT